MHWHRQTSCIRSKPILTVLQPFASSPVLKAVRYPYYTRHTSSYTRSTLSYTRPIPVLSTVLYPSYAVLYPSYTVIYTHLNAKHDSITKQIKNKWLKPSDDLNTHFAIFCGKNYYEKFQIFLRVYLFVHKIWPTYFKMSFLNSKIIIRDFPPPYPEVWFPPHLLPYNECFPPEGKL